MGPFFIHIIKSSLCLIIFYLSYKALLSKETFYKVNRFVLLAIIAVSVLIPFFKMTVTAPAVATVPQRLSNIENMILQKQIHFKSFTTDSIDGFYSLLFFAFVIGVIIQLVITITNFIKIYHLTHRSTRINYDGYILAITDHAQSPFSWGRYIVISKEDYNNNPEIIMQHELIHLKRLHSIDLFIAECAIILFWFNPVIWLLKKELKDIHEFEVDDTLIGQGVDAKQYQLMLIRKAVGPKLYSVANTFNQSSLSKRIRMMLKQRSNPWAQLKYLCIILLSLFSVIAFARPDVTNKLKAINLENLINKQVTGITTDSRLHPDLKSGNKPDNKDGRRTGEDAPQTDTTPVQKAAVPDSNLAGHNQNGIISPLCIVDGKETSYSDFQQIAPNAIKTVKVLTPKDAIALYGEKGKNGAVIISLNPEVKRTIINNKKSYAIFDDEPPVYVFFVKGEKVGDAEQAVLNSQLSKIMNEPERIESAIIMKGQAAISKYGEAGKNGIVEIYLNNLN